jgi:cytochrome P450
MGFLLPLLLVVLLIVVAVLTSTNGKHLLNRYKLYQAGIPLAEADVLNRGDKGGYNILLGHLPQIARHKSLSRYQFYSLLRHLKKTGQLDTPKQDNNGPNAFLLAITALRTLFVTAEPETVIQCMLQKNYPKDDYAPLRPLLGNGLLTSEGDRWKSRRRVFNHGFKPEFLRQMAPGMSQITEVLCNVLHAHAVLKPNQPINMGEVLTRSTLDVIGLVGFSTNFKFTEELLECYLSGKESQNAVLDLVQQNLQEPNERFRNPIRNWTHPTEDKKYQAALQQFLDMGRDIVAKAMANSDADASSILGLMVKLGRESEDDKMDANEYLDEIMTFLVAGNETTASTTSFWIRLLDLYPQTASDLQKEVDSVLEQYPLSADAYAIPPGELNVHAVTYEEQEKMPLMWNHLREVLRLYPVAPGSVRVFPESSDLVDGYNLPQGTRIFIPYYTLHRRPDIWGQDAGDYDPSRWSDETRLPNPKTMLGCYVPFALGPRTCIGNLFAKIEFRIIAATLMRYFEFQPVVPEEELKEMEEVKQEALCLQREGIGGVNAQGKEMVFHEAITMRPKSCLVKIKLRSK